MPITFTIILFLLLALAVIDLIVGVSNDAINFLNSSLGSRVASRRVIFSVAAIGILAGVLTSTGMMQVARTGVMHPQFFTFTEIMYLYAAVMMTDVILLNAFNKLGLPTSTTVSMIFELLGAAVAVTLFKYYAGTAPAAIGDMVNSGKALGMISAILVSVALSFVLGAIVMFVSRLLFSFRYARMFRLHGPWWCAIAVVGILYFALIKGLKSSPLMPAEALDFIDHHTAAMLAGSWVVVSLLFYLLQHFKVNLLRITILSGTFSLALAFAGNDLVNFIGVPLAGLDAYQTAVDSGTAITMGSLAQETPANTWILLGAGVVMVLALFFSKDAMRVSQTELTLASQRDENERFGSSLFSRLLVRQTLSAHKNLMRALPDSWIDFISKRFIPLSASERANANYDLIRAVVNLACASILICVGTSLRLPLSTTYVVFMVSMGSSLADRAWGRESAVYRINGVMVVIMGWFLTALIAFTVAAVMAVILLLGKTVALIILAIVCAGLLCRRFLSSGKKFETGDADDELTIKRGDTPEVVIKRCVDNVGNTMQRTGELYGRMLIALFSENRHAMNEINAEAEKMYRVASDRKYSMVGVLKDFTSSNVATGQFYVQATDYLCEVTKALMHCTRRSREHLDNNHRGLSGSQVHVLNRLNEKVSSFLEEIDAMLHTGDFTQLDYLMTMRDNLFDDISDAIGTQIKQLKTGSGESTRATALYFDLLNETKTMIMQARNLIKAQAYFTGSAEAPTFK